MYIRLTGQDSEEVGRFKYFGYAAKMDGKMDVGAPQRVMYGIGATEGVKITVNQGKVRV